MNILGANFLSTGRYFKPVSTSGQQKLVAKVYNPLYYDDDEDFLSPFLCVDRNYTHETNAYTLLIECEGDRVPRFFGSYNLDLPVEEHGFHKICRTVRLILMEYIEGTTMLQLKPEKVSRRARQQIMKSIIDLKAEFTSGPT